MYIKPVLLNWQGGDKDGLKGCKWGYKVSWVGLIDRSSPLPYHYPICQSPLVVCSCFFLLRPCKRWRCHDITMCAVYFLLRERDKIYCKYFQCSPPFSRTDTLFFSPRAFSQKPTLPHSGKLPQVIHVPTFKTACKMTSHRCIEAYSVSPKKQLLTTLMQAYSYVIWAYNVWSSNIR